jgi:glucose/arabinose dehydrogenase
MRETRKANRSWAPALWGFLLLCSISTCSARGHAGENLGSIRLPPGFTISLFSGDVPGARSLALSPSGVLYVGTQDAGKVYALVDRNGDGKADHVYTVASGLDTPNGVAWKDGALYVGLISRVLRLDAIDEHLEHPPKPVPVGPTFPSDRSHGWKFIRFGPDGLLYVPVGAPCNICEIKDPYAAIHRMRVDGSNSRQLFARGVRNTVGFDWQPGTGVLWFTDNGRDWLGDDLPPDELNRAPQAGLHFGYPFCHGGDLADPHFGEGHPCSQYTPPAIKLGAHVASLGMRFYTGTMFPAEYRNQIFIAEHGSWNRSTPVGYRVSLVKVEGDRAVSYQPFAEGWLGGGRNWGRPVDVQVALDGALLVSDDKAGAIYRIAYTGTGGTSGKAANPGDKPVTR